jgi:hypothetical protein
MGAIGPEPRRIWMALANAEFALIRRAITRLKQENTSKRLLRSKTDAINALLILRKLIYKYRGFS